MKIELICQCCDKPFETEYKFRDKKFCSRGCYFENVRKGKLKIGRNKDESIREVRLCKVCDKEFEVKKNHSKEMCSNECRVKWGENDVVKQKRLISIKKTVQEKYGVNHVWNNKDIHQKTMDNRDLTISSEKQKNTVREKHMVKLMSRLEDNNLKLLSNYTTNKDSKNATSISYEFDCLICNNKFTSTVLGSGLIPRCNICYPSQKYSKIQNVIQLFLNEKKINYIQNNRKVIAPYEIDFFIPEYNLGIEIHGLYFHGELNGKDKNYHINKSVMANKKNIKLIQIFEDEILHQKDIVLSKLSHELKLNDFNKIDARKCEIKIIDNKLKSDFLFKNHLQGDAKDSVRYGLFHNKELVSVMTFGKRKISGGLSSNWEMIRFCNKNNYSIRGGFSKLLSYILKNCDIKNFITFSDCRWSGVNENETVYFKNNFTFISKTTPSYWYFKSSTMVKRHHRFNFRKSKLISEGFDPNKTEWEIMQERGFDRIWDCGTMKFSYNV